MFQAVVVPYVTVVTVFAAGGLVYLSRLAFVLFPVAWLPRHITVEVPHNTAAIVQVFVREV